MKPAQFDVYSPTGLGAAELTLFSFVRSFTGSRMSRRLSFVIVVLTIAAIAQCTAGALCRAEVYYDGVVQTRLPVQVLAMSELKISKSKKGKEKEPAFQIRRSESKGNLESWLLFLNCFIFLCASCAVRLRCQLHSQRISQPSPSRLAMTSRTHRSTCHGKLGCNLTNRFGHFYYRDIYKLYMISI